MKNENLEFLAFGRTLKTMTPSGRIFTIREQNGDDDDILSNTSTANDLSNIDNFLNAIVVSETIGDKECNINFSTITSLPNNDRYHLLIASRIHTLGPIMKFQYEFEPGVPIDFEEDLSQYLHDYTTPFPEPGEPGYSKYKIPPYPANSDHTSTFSFTTKSGKTVSFGLMTRIGEKYVLSLPNDQQSRNTELKARNLQLLVDGVLTKVENFSIFSKMDMIEIHKAVQEIDPTYNFVSDIQNPKTKAIINFPIMFSPSFFFPVEV